MTVALRERLGQSPAGMRLIQSTLSLLTSLLVLGACSEDKTESCSGQETCPCYGNGSCDDGLECHSGLCVNPEISTAPRHPEAGTPDNQSSDGGNVGDEPGAVPSPGTPHNPATPVTPQTMSDGGTSLMTLADGPDGASNQTPPHSQPDAGDDAPDLTSAVSSTTEGPVIQPPANCDEAPLVWIVLAKGTSMFESPIGETPAWNVVRDTLIGNDGLIPGLEGEVHFGLTLFDGAAAAQCPTSTDEVPADDTEAIVAALDAVTEPETKQETPMPAVLASVLETVRARPESRRYILAIGGAHPDFCDDGSAECAFDSLAQTAQAGYAEGIRTLVAGVESYPSLDGATVPLFQGFANAGAGFPVVDSKGVVNFPCEGDARADYSETAGDNAVFAYGSPSSTAFAETLRAMVNVVTVCED